MKVKVIKVFKDKYTGKRYAAGEIIEVSKERFDEILTVDKLVEKVAVEVAEEAAEAPKKKNKKSAK